jgi:hypothetical protein
VPGEVIGAGVCECSIDGGPHDLVEVDDVAEWMLGV